MAVIDRDQALMLLERTDRHGGFKGVPTMAGKPRPLGLVLEVLDECDRYQIQPSTAKGYLILAIRNRGFGWLAYYVWDGEEDRKAEWP